MALKLTEGALEIIMTGGQVAAPVMQILGSKKLAGSNAVERYRLLISDGKYLNSFAMVATQLNDLIANGDLCEFTVVKINRYITSLVNNSGDKERRVMVILELEIIKKGTEVGLRIGNPVNFEAGASNSGSTNSTTAKPAPAPAPKAKAPAFKSQVQMSPGPNSTIHPISSLNPYQNKWTIKARVTNKMAPRTYTNARGEGKLFSVTFTDESGEMKCTGFNSCVDKFGELLELNKVYMVSNCSLKPANKKFTQADYEMTFHDDSQVVPCSDDVALPATLYNFTPINKITDLSLESIIDVVGVVKQVSPVQTLISKNTGKELKKRDVTIVDQSGASVNLTLWGSQAEEFDGSREPVIAAKGVRLNEFRGGRSVGTLMSSTLQVDPDIPEAHRLRGWYDNGGSMQEAVCISASSGDTGGSGGNWILQGELTSQGLGLGDKADYFSGVVTVLMARSENCVYKACPGTDCKKKVMDMNNGQYRCEKCNREYDHFSYRLLLSEYFTNLAFKKFQMKFRTKMESYNDENRLKTTVVTAGPVDSIAYTKRLLTDFKAASGVTTGR